MVVRHEVDVYCQPLMAYTALIALMGAQISSLKYKSRAGKSDSLDSHHIGYLVLTLMRRQAQDRGVIQSGTSWERECFPAPGSRLPAPRRERKTRHTLWNGIRIPLCRQRDTRHMLPIGC